MDGLFSSFTGGIALVIVALSAFIALKFLQTRKPIKQVLFLRPRDRRGETLLVTRETDRSVWCERANPIHRFIKFGPAYEFHENGRLVTRFLGIEGSAYTADLSTPNPKPLKKTLAEILEDFPWYQKLPQKFKDQVEKTKYGIVVDADKIEERKYGLPKLTSDDVNDEADAVILQRIAQGTKVSTAKREFYQLMVGIGLGIGIALMLIRWGIL